MASAIKTFVSAGLDRIEAGEPVVLFLHGYGADERDLPSLMSYLPALPWASLRAPSTSQHGGYSWYPMTSPLDPSAEYVAAPTRAVWDWVDAMLPEDSPLVVIGFSQGGLMATQLLRTRPSRLVATVILAGFIVEGEQPADSELAASRPKVIYCRGLEDQMISREAVARLNVWLQTHTRATTKAYSGLGHSIDDRVMNDVASYVEAQLN